MAAFQFNEEQVAILDHLHYRDSQILGVNALAGTGKTTTLKAAAEYPLKEEFLRYFVFNKRNADEASGVFPRNTQVSTAHSFAFRAPHPDGGGSMQEVYASSQSRLINGSLYGPFRDQMKQSMEFADRIGQIRQELRCSEGRAIMAIQSILRQYCQSADPEIGAQHIASDLGEYAHRSGLRGSPKATLGAAAWVWDRMRDPFSRFPVDHGVYLKLCSLAPPRIPVDTILFDEAQDASPPMLEILKAQLAYGTRLVLVGDTYQHIYDFTGAVDAMKVMQADHADLTTTLPLATSYRFGQDVADAGNHFLRLMGSPYLLKGKGAEGRVHDGATGPVHAVLFRGNSSLLQAAVQAVEAQHKIHVVGGTGDIVKLIEAMGRMYKGEFAKHPELSFFDNWQQLSEYAQTPLGSGMAPLTRIVEGKQGRVESIVKALMSTETDPRQAQYILSTGHKSKGGQWDNVLLMDDFQRSWMNVGDEEQPYRLPGHDELCLQYVACTRAQKTLYTNGLLHTMERILKKTQSEPESVKMVDESMLPRIPEVLAGINAWKNPLIITDPVPSESLTGGEPLQGATIPKTLDKDFLDHQFGSDTALGVRWQEIAGTQGEMESLLPDGTSATVCTNYAEQIKKGLPDHSVDIVGFANENNPNSAVVREEWHPGGHDFAIVDHRWLVDPWARLVACARHQIVYDCQDAQDALKVIEIYGDPKNWSLSGSSRAAHSDMTVWDRPSLNVPQKSEHLRSAEKIAQDSQKLVDDIRQSISAPPMYALADTVENARKHLFMQGPDPDKKALIAFAEPNTLLVELRLHAEPVVVGMITDKSRSGLLQAACREQPSSDPLAQIDPDSEKPQEPIFAYGRRP